MNRLIRFLILPGLLLSMLAQTSPGYTQDTAPLVVTGQVRLATPESATLPATMTVQLQLVNETATVVQQFSQEISTDGSTGNFRFEDIPYREDVGYALLTSYDGVTQTLLRTLNANELRQLSLSGRLELTVYDAIPEFSTLDTQASGQMLITFDEVPESYIDEERNMQFTGNQLPVLSVALELSILNQSPYIVYGEQTPEGRSYAFKIELPIGAFNIAFGAELDTEQARLFHNGETVYDTLPVVPERLHQLQVSYMVPYTEGAVLDQIFPVTLDRFNILLPEETVTLNSTTFTQESEFVTEEQETYWKFTLNAPHPGNESLIFTINGNPASLTSTAERTVTPSQENEDDGSILPIIILIVVAGFILIFAGGWINWRQKLLSPEEET